MKKSINFLLVFITSIHLYAYDLSSRYYYQMFPKDVDEKELIVIIPSKLQRQQIDNLMADKSTSDKNYIYERYCKYFEGYDLEVINLVKKNNLKCKVVEANKYDTITYPKNTYPYVIYPEILTVNNYFITYGYRLIDVKKNEKYGFAMNTDSNLKQKYFKQASKYISKLSKKKKGVKGDQDLSEIVETNIYYNQKHKRNFIRYIVSPLAGVIVIGGIILAGPLTD